MDETTDFLNAAKNQFTSAKLKVKEWEEDYVSKNGSKPNKEALSSAPDDIKAAYKSYWKCRKILADPNKYDWCDLKPSEKHTVGVDTVNTNECGAEKSTNPVENVNISESKGTSALSLTPNTVPNTSSTDVEPKIITETALKNNVWGKHLNVSNSIEMTTKVQPESLYSKMAAKLRSCGATSNTRYSLKKFSVKKPSNIQPLKKVNSTDSQEDKENCVRINNEHNENKAESSLNFKPFEDEATDDLGFIKTNLKIEQSSSSFSKVQSINLLDGNNVKARSLNRNWVTRCTNINPSSNASAGTENWKMNIVDKEWNEQSDDDIFANTCEDEEEMNEVDNSVKIYNSPKKSKAKKKSKPAKIPQSTITSKATEKNEIDENYESTENNKSTEKNEFDETCMLSQTNEQDGNLESEENTEKNVVVASTSTLETNSRKSNSKKNNGGASIRKKIIQKSNDFYEQESEDESFSDSQKIRKKKVEELDEVEDLTEIEAQSEEDPAGSKPRTRSVRSCRKKVDNSLQSHPDNVSDNDFSFDDDEDDWQPTSEMLSVKKDDDYDDKAMSDEEYKSRGKKRTLEEMEADGEIVSSWPPPKKEREAIPDKKNVGRVLKKTKIRTKTAIGQFEKKQQTKRTRKTKVDTTSKEGSVKVKVSRVRKTTKTKSNPPKKATNVKTNNPPTNSNVSDPSNAVKIDQVASNANGTENASLEYDEILDMEQNGPKRMGKRSYMSKEQYFEKKITSGKANQNFVRINLKKKVFVRGKFHMTAEKHKRREWKMKQIEKSAEGGNEKAVKSFTCFKCGEFGHWAKNCVGIRGNKLQAMDQYDEKDLTYLTLDEAEGLTYGIKPLPQQSISSQPKQVIMEEKQGEMNEDVLPNSITDEKEENMSIEIENDKDNLPIENDLGVLELNENTKVVVNDFSSLPVTKSSVIQSMDEVDTRIFDEFNSLAHIESSTSKKVDETLKNTSSIDTMTVDAFDDDIDWVSVSDSLKEVENKKNTTDFNNITKDQTIQPLYPLEDGKTPEVPTEVYEALQLFGYSSFRPGQGNTIMRILSGQSTLLILSTGSGKSLCYQLPAYLYAQKQKCITICVSPLVSLMEDQVTGLPNFLRAVCLHTNQNPTQRQNALEALRAGAQILLVSPEAIVATRGGGVLGTLLKELPPIAFVCLDEAHCVSEWSHNFRPSYLRLCHVLRERLNVKTFLGLTATAKYDTALSIGKHLQVLDFESGIIRGTCIPDNLILSVSRDEFKEQALVSLLNGDRFSKCCSIIIYCTRRTECERVAAFIRTQTHTASSVNVENNKKRVRGVSYEAEAYHAGLSGYRRGQIQKWFMSGKLRIVIATVAFGMGIDKSDVRGIIHFNMPRNLESYVQEIGRAGRDGEISHCHLFLDSVDGNDLQELKRHIFANSVDRHTIRKLLSEIFMPCKCAKIKRLSQGCKNSEDVILDCPGHEVALPIEPLVQMLNLPEENLQTLLCYLELLPNSCVELKHHVYATCEVTCYGGPRQLCALSHKCPPLAVAIALERQKGVTHETKNSITFPVVSLASQMGWKSSVVKSELKNIEWNFNGGKYDRTGATVQFSELAFHLVCRGDLEDNELDEILEKMYTRSANQEKDQLRQLQYTYQTLRATSYGTIIFCCDTVEEGRTNKLKATVREYFAPESKVLESIPLYEQHYLKPEVKSRVAACVREFIGTHVDHTWTGRSVAKIFHGIGSPNHPVQMWGRVRRFWRSHLNIDFNLLVSIATEQIIQSR